jgi:hypothetical protein
MCHADGTPGSKLVVNGWVHGGGSRHSEVIAGWRRPWAARPHLRPSPYECRRPETGGLYRVVNEHLRTFQAMTEETGRPLPKYVWQEFERFLDCGILSRGTTVTY